MAVDSKVIAQAAARLTGAMERGRAVAPVRDLLGAQDIGAAYAVQQELTRRRLRRGAVVVGRKIGLANRAVWRALKLKTLVWASMYDDTVHFADNGHGAVSVSRMRAPRIEPEILHGDVHSVFDHEGAGGPVRRPDASPRRRPRPAARPSGASPPRILPTRPRPSDGAGDPPVYGCREGNAAGRCRAHRPSVISPAACRGSRAMVAAAAP